MKINIPNPCNENWNNMSPVEKGKHCDSCSKTVVDFSEMDEKGIQQYFIQKATTKESICGHFKAEQVIVKRPWHHQILVNLHAYIDAKIQFSLGRKIALSTLSIGFMLTGCNEPMTGEVIALANTGDVNENDSANHRLMLGAIQMIPDSIGTKQHTDSTKTGSTIKGNIKCTTSTTTIEDTPAIDYSNFLLGDVSYDYIEDHKDPQTP